MISFDRCPYCSNKPRVQFNHIKSEDKKKIQEEITYPLENINIRVTVNDYYYRCNDCGTYYRFESDFFGTIGYFDIRLVRITIIEALSVFQSDFKTSGDFDKAYQEAKDSDLWDERTIFKLLKSSNPQAREFGAETLADLYKKEKKPEKIRELLQSSDADIRLGILWSYAEIPWHSYMLNTPRLNTYQGIFYYKPYGKLSSVLKNVLALLCDPDKRIRVIAKSFIENFFIGKSDTLLAKLHHMPKEKWSAELKYFIINNNYPWTNEKSFVELCDFLLDPDEETRLIALRRIYDCYSEKNIPMYIDYIKKLSKLSSNPQIEWFLEHPYIGLEKDDDDYYD
ncbi:MAG: hypothetical protein A2086_09350 [Spirochaetes bacterium GWD1_27_9]|nr:MAG: hypothetical protein A2Z98_18285 [Spirochaetes bacterium GWB1_27_13]OHD24096.1 MAG: hypothetical protein A2Y34_09325 [Spirochaetes bacterium GWC1_27_15]OHD37366.1 MAG: hypothetical protein A2086_09350 [Spirochaetes bacterium GWD1_27_9]